MVSAAVCVGGKERHLYILDEKAKVIAAYYLEQVLPKLVGDFLYSCYRVVSSSSKTALRLKARL